MPEPLPYIPVSYADMGFDTFGRNLAVSQQFTSANNSDAFFEPGEGSIRTNKVRDLAITNAKIVSLSTQKISGNLISAVGVGDEETVVLDGENNSIKIYDDSGNLTVWIQGGPPNMKARIARDDYPGMDMEGDEFFKFALREDKQVYKIAEYAEISVTILSGTSYASGTHIHGLGFVPIVKSTVKYGSNGYPYMGVLMPYIEAADAFMNFNVTWDNNQVLFEVAADIFGDPTSDVTFVLECYIMNNQQ